MTPNDVDFSFPFSEVLKQILSPCMSLQFVDANLATLHEFKYFGCWCCHYA